MSDQPVRPTRGKRKFTAISLNAWAGICLPELLSFVRTAANAGIDALFFQEVFRSSAPPQDRLDNGEVPNLFELLAKELPDYRGSFTNAQDAYYFLDNPCRVVKANFDLQYGLCCFIRADRGHVFSAPAHHMIFGEENDWDGIDREAFPRAMAVTLLTPFGDGKTMALANLHGLWQKNNKVDSPERIGQSHRINATLRRYGDYPQVVMGDFNLRPDTISLDMVAKDGRRTNLNERFGITDTRTSLYTGLAVRAADYALVKNVEALDLQVLLEGNRIPGSDIVFDKPFSDHAALYLELHV